LGQGYLLLGELDKARECIEKGLEIHRSAGLSLGMPAYHIDLGHLHFELGDLENAQRYIEEGLKLAQNNEEWSEGLARAWLGRVVGKADISQSSIAEEYIQQGIGILDELKLRPYACQGNLYLGELYADTGQKDKALEALKKAEAEFKDMGMDYWLRRTQEALERVQG
jgi:tetratricopeptide (TPR) repeat protein